MKYFIETCGVDPTAKDKIQQTALYYASREGRFKTCEYLIQQGVPLNDIDLYHQTPVYYASRYLK
jgi:ankyrin repeat protein